jgi:type I restriction enzyme S subunit
MNKGAGRVAWVTKRLGDITTKIGSGATPLGGEEAYKESGICLIRSLNVHDWGFKEAKLAHIDDAQASRLSNAVVEANDVLLNITGASVARCCLAPPEFQPARVNQHVSIIRPAQDHLLPAFLHYLLISKTYKDRLLDTGEDGGSTRQAITKAQIQEFRVEFPESLTEQRRIVGILDEAFDGIATAKANAEKNLQNARALFEGHLNAVFTQEGQGWVQKRLGDICHKITDGTHATPTYTKSGVPFLSVKDLTKGFIDFSDTRFISLEDHQALTKRCKPAKNDVLYTKVGTTGVAQVVDVDREFSIFVSVALLKINHDIVYNSYLEHFLNAPYAREQARQRTRGMANKNLVITDIKEIVVHFPKSLDQQRTLVTELDALRAETQRLESIYHQKLAALEALKKSLLDQAFTGAL